MLRLLTYEVSIEEGGIFRRTVEELYEKIEFMHFRATCFVNFFTLCMAIPIPCRSIKSLLFSLTGEYVLLYEQCVSKTTGSLEKRQKAGKVMITNLESKRGQVRSTYKAKFVSLDCIRESLGLPENESHGGDVNEESNLVYCYIEDLLYTNFWKWLQKEKGNSVHNYIKERDTDLSYVFSPVMQGKLYDITGYLCGYRIHSLVTLNRIKSDYKRVFLDYHLHSRLQNGHIAMEVGLPAECLLFREHSGGLYYSKPANFEFIKIVQAIWMQCLTTDVLIIFNSQEPVKLVHNLILNSKVVQNAFKLSCFMLTDCFTSSINLAADVNAISYLYQFIIQGFVRVYAKDIYQLRLSNVLLSKTGASGIRTTLLTLSACASNPKHDDVDKITDDNINATSESNATVNVDEAVHFICPCGKGYRKKSKTWYARHITLCSKYIFMNTGRESSEPPINKESIYLDNLVELECIEDIGDFIFDVDTQVGLNLEKKTEDEEKEFDRSFIEGIIIDENDENNYDN